MRAAPLRWFAWLFMAVVLYGLYQRIVSTPAPEQSGIEELEAKADLAEQRIARLRIEAAQADQAIDQAIDKAQNYEEMQRGRAVFTSEIALTTMLRTAMVECYYNNGEWPIDGCGIDPKELTGQLLQRVEIEPEGVLQLGFVAGYGLPPITLRLSAEVKAGRIGWRCSSNDYAEISTLLHDCRYQR